jgi:hypothetical protein
MPAVKSDGINISSDFTAFRTFFTAKKAQNSGSVPFCFYNIPDKLPPPRE